jgi:hypothetical protein
MSARRLLVTAALALAVGVAVVLLTHDELAAIMASAGVWLVSLADQAKRG